MKSFKILASIAALSAVFGCATTTPVMTDGTYTGVGQGRNGGVAGGRRKSERVFIEAERHRLLGRGGGELGQRRGFGGLSCAQHEGTRTECGCSKEMAAIQGHGALRVCRD